MQKKILEVSVYKKNFEVLKEWLIIPGKRKL